MLIAPSSGSTVICGYCSVGCGLDLHLTHGEPTILTPSPHYPVNLGMACPKGWEALTPLGASDRATTPLLRNAKGQLEPISWPQALDVMVDRMKRIARTYGRDALAFLSTGQIVTEEMALLGALCKFGIGMIHGDGNTRQCMASAVVAYKQAFGFDAPPYTYRDLQESDVIVLVGSNLCIAHPILWGRVCRNPHKPAVVVVDPRKTDTALAATHHLALRPKSDLVLFHGLARILIERGWIDRPFIDAHTSGFDALARSLSAFTVDHVASVTGLRPDEITGLAELIHSGKRVSLWWTMGVNQSHEGVRLAQSIITVALLTGNIGRPGTGANSITGQCNAMGSRLFSNTTNLLGGYSFDNKEHRQRVASILEIDPERIPTQDSLAYDQILEKVLRGHIRGLWIVATNPAHSWINQLDAHEVLRRAEFVVVQDMYSTTETTQFAHLILPAAGWAEKEGTFINSERRIGLVKRLRHAPGQALSDFHIFRLVAEAWGLSNMFKRWSTPEAVFQILKELSRGQPCDITGIADYAMLDRQGGIQWPCPDDKPDDATERRLFEDGRFYHPDGKAKFIFEGPRPMPEAPSKEYPLLLLTGRGSSSQWHTQTRTKKSPVLRKLYPNTVTVEISPADARTLGITPNDWVTVRSRRAAILARAFVTHTVRAGEVFLPMHYEDVNRLTFSAFDPYSRQPAYKACAVSVERALQRPVNT